MDDYFGCMVTSCFTLNFTKKKMERKSQLNDLSILIIFIFSATYIKGNKDCDFLYMEPLRKQMDDYFGCMVTSCFTLNFTKKKNGKKITTK